MEQETQSTFAQSSSGGTDLENRLMDIAWGGEGEGERVGTQKTAWKHTLPYVK